MSFYRRFDRIGGFVMNTIEEQIKEFFAINETGKKVGYIQRDLKVVIDTRVTNITITLGV